VITKTQSFQTSDGTIHATIDDAQAWELKTLLMQDTLGLNKEQQEQTSKMFVTYRDKVVDILTTGPKSRPKARVSNGATRAKRKKATPTPTADLGLSK